MSERNRTLPMSDNDRVFSALVKQMCQANPHALLAFLLDARGNLYCPEGLSAGAVQAGMPMVLPFRELAERATAEIGCGLFQHMLVEGSSGTLAIADVDGERTAVVLGPAGAAPGALRADAVWLARSLRGGLT